MSSRKRTTSPFQSAQERKNKSCVECRRRKIRCDGNHPCNKCIYYEVPDCQFYPRKRRKFAREDTHNDKSDNSKDAAYILKKLFPSSSPDSLVHLTRSELLQFAQNETLPDSRHPQRLALTEPSDQSVDSDDEREWNEPEEVQNPSSAVCDDVNGLSLSAHRRSYMGISSIRAILRTMFRLAPQLRNISLNNRQVPNSPSLTGESLLNHDLQTSIPSVDESTSIDAYFAHFHGVVPLLDEAEFRSHWKRGNRSDRPWLALLSMVLVLGSVAGGGPNDDSHRIYYARAKTYLDLELLGIGCVESLQALCLLGGCYLHYRNSPNMASTIMGTALRIAVALGLHREPIDEKVASRESRPNKKHYHRRRIWWSLFCLDTWGSMTLGRPTLGRWDPETMDVLPIGGFDVGDSTELSLLCSQDFCMIATRVQHRFVQIRPITTKEISIFDTELQDWYQKLPPIFQQSQECPEHLISAKYVMRNRYFNLRLLLYRPVLLSYANRKVALSSLQSDEQSAIHHCRTIACDAVDQIALMMRELTTLRVWNAVWYLYQASMVVLLSIITDPNDMDAENWRACTEMALQLFDTMSPWSPAAKRSKQVLLEIFRAITTPYVDSSEMIRDSFDMTTWDQFGFDAFRDDWPWGEMTSGFDDFSQYPQWMGEQS